MRHRLLSSFAAAWVLAVLLAPDAAADDKRACVAASDAAQTARSDGHLAAARAELLSCAREACPAVVRQFCEKWLDEVHAITPSVVVRVSDSQRRDVTDVRVLVDGKLLAATLDGRPLEVDPGVHVFRFEPSGAPAFEHKIVVVEGEKDRVLAETIPTLAAPVTRPQAAVVDATSPPTRGPVPVAAYVLGGAGVAALGGFLYFAVSGQSEYGDCVSHGCSSATESSIDVRRALAWSSFGVGVAALGAGACVFLLGRAHRGAHVGLAPLPGGGAARLSAEF